MRRGMLPGFLLPVHRASFCINATAVIRLLRFLSSIQDSWRVQAIPYVIPTVNIDSCVFRAVRLRLQPEAAEHDDCPRRPSTI
jgi:hypothetical protein